MQLQYPLQDISQRFFRALLLKATNKPYQKIDDFYTIIYPGCKGANVKGSGGPYSDLCYIPMPSLIALEKIDVTWKDFWNINYINNYLRNRLIGGYLKINVPVDEVVGEAIHNRLSGRQGVEPPKPYEHQADIMVLLLAVLDYVRRNLRQGKLVEAFNEMARLSKNVVALLTDTASGKTECFETITLQLVLDLKHGALNNQKDERLVNYVIGNVKVIIYYPMKSFMLDHIRRFIRDIALINERIAKEMDTNFMITIGILTGDTRGELELNEAKKEVEYLLGKLECPLCGKPINIYEGEYLRIRIVCSNGHDLSFIRLDRKSIMDNPPDILLTTIDFINYHNSQKDIVRDLFRHGPPILVVLDEPHTYTGVFGANVSLFLRTFENIMHAKFNLRDYKPFYIVTSATIPHEEEFLTKLLVIEPKRMYIYKYSYSHSEVYSESKSKALPHNLGLIALLPSESYTIANAAVEIPLIIAALLERKVRKALVFVDSIEYAETLKFQISSYNDPERFCAEYKVCKKSDVFSKDVCSCICTDKDSKRLEECYKKCYNKDFVKVEVLHARLSQDVRSKIEREFRDPNVPMILITTSAAEVGVDVSEVSAVVLVGIPPSPISFRQRIGRTGRQLDRPGLIILIGDEGKPTDTYYLSDWNTLQTYLTAHRDIHLPITPVNPVLIRAWSGNYIRGYPDNIQRAKDKILKEYEHYAIDYVKETFQNLDKEYANIIIKQIQTFENSIKNDLLIIMDALLCKGYHILRPNRIETIRGLVSDAIGQYIPFLVLELRSSGKEIPIYLPKGFYNLIDRINNLKYCKEFSVEKKLAIAQCSIAYDLEHIKQCDESLRGTLHKRTIGYDNKLMQFLFEVGYIKTEKPFRFERHKYILDAILSYSSFMKTLLDQSYHLEELFGEALHAKSMIMRSRDVRKLQETLATWLQNQEYKSRGSPTGDFTLDLYDLESIYLDYLLPGMFKIVTPSSQHIIWVKRLKDLKAWLKKEIGRGLSYQSLDRRHIFIEQLPYLVAEEGINKERFARKLLWSSKINLVEIGKDYHYDYHNCDLILHTNQGKISYKQEHIKTKNVSKADVIDSILTRPIVLTLVVNYGKTVDERSNAVFKLTYMDDVEVLILNAGFWVRRRIDERRGVPLNYFKRIGSKDYPALLGYKYRTKALKIEIYWRELIKNYFKDFRSFSEFAYNEYKKSLEQMPRSINIDESNIQLLLQLATDFRVRFTHSLSHALINFHPLYTGAYSYDAAEYIRYDYDPKQEKSEVIIFDYDEGGSGVSEIIYRSIRSILAESLVAILQVDDRLHGAYKVIASPMDLLFHIWPICPLGNNFLSRVFYRDLMFYMVKKYNPDIDSENIKQQLKQGVKREELREEIEKGLKDVIP